MPRALSISEQPPDELVPVWRGVLHAYAFWCALAAAAGLLTLAPTHEARLASAVYGIALCALFAISGLYHRWRWDPRWRPLLRRLDHSTIFLFIAASTTPVALLVLAGTAQTVVLLAAMKRKIVLWSSLRSSGRHRGSQRQR